MTREEVLVMAREAQTYHATDTWAYSLAPNQLERFTALVAAHEREECAKVCEKWKKETLAGITREAGLNEMLAACQAQKAAALRIAEQLLPTMDTANLLEQAAKQLAASQAREAKLRDFAQWLTGCCDLTQYEYFLQNRHILAEQPNDTALKEYHKQVLLEAAEWFEKGPVGYWAAIELRKLAEEP